MKSQLPVRFYSASALFNTALRWWLQGLSGLWPKAWRSLISKTQPVLWRLEQPLDRFEKHGNASTRTDLSIDLPATPTEPSASLSKTTPLLIGLHHDDVLFLTLFLPASAQSKLREAVSFQLITEAPLPRADLYFDSHVVRRIDKHRIEVAVVIGKKETVRTLAARLEQQGFVNIAIGYADESSATLDAVFYTSPAIKSAQSRSRKTMILGICILLSVLAFNPILYTAATLKTRALNRQNDELQHRVDNYAELLAQRSRQETMMTDLRKNLPRYRLTDALNRIAGLMPHSAWLTSVRFDQGSIQLVGNAADPTDMMKALAGFSGGQLKLMSVTHQPNSSAAAQFEINVQLQ
ncbi:MAG: PilN domain-containing protein [Gammaproteobacteria bacterium]